MSRRHASVRDPLRHCAISIREEVSESRRRGVAVDLDTKPSRSGLALDDLPAAIEEAGYEAA